jgi:glycosyltransferase involved in cell wall biosynthesis
MVLLRLRRRTSHAVWYNYQAHYVFALILARVLRLRCILDLEDGLRSDDGSFRHRVDGLLLKLHVGLCGGGAMLACRQLAHQAAAARTFVCYGVVEAGHAERDWSASRLQVLLGGSLLRNTGADLFLDALSVLSRDSPQTLTRLRFVVTGFGDRAARLESAALSDFAECLRFRGRVTGREYAAILEASHVGLCLKLPSSPMGVTTFPSKVVELAAQGLLVVSTRVSDVPVLFDGSSAVLLEHATADALAKVLTSIAQDPRGARELARAGQTRVTSLLSEERVGADLLRFWNGESSESGTDAGACCAARVSHV